MAKEYVINIGLDMSRKDTVIQEMEDKLKGKAKIKKGGGLLGGCPQVVCDPKHLGEVFKFLKILEREGKLTALNEPLEQDFPEL